MFAQPLPPPPFSRPEASAVTGDHRTVFAPQHGWSEGYPSSAAHAALTTVHPSAVATAETARILASIGEASYDWDIGTDALLWSANVGAVLTIADAATVATNRLYARLLDPDNMQTRYDAVMHASQRDDDGKGVPYQIEYGLRLGPDPHKKTWIEDTGRWFAGLDGRPVRAHGVIRIIDERHAQQQRLAFLSRYDGLTGEMNRLHLTEALGEALRDSLRFRSSCGFLLVAIDNLARINEAYGFDVADEVIAAVAKRIRAKMRGGDSLGRFSGNKFGIVLRDCTPEDIAIAAERLLAEVRDEVVETSTVPVAVTATIGGVAAPRHARTVHEIVARAQESLDAAKAKRRGSYVAYRPSVEREAMRRENARATDEIVAALNERRILLVFEPVVAAISRKPAFYECLMRIRRADGTLLAAADIIPVAERLGLVRLIDHRVVELAVAELVSAPDLKVSLNVSPASTFDPDWWETFAALMRRHAGVAARIAIEITEMAAFQNVDDAIGFVTRIKDLGCCIAIDDFGVGNTSFRNLRRLGVDIVKIDGSFVQNLSRSADDRLFVRTMVELAGGLGLSTVAEWVQDEKAARMLTEWGCDYLQGALVGAASIERSWGSAGTLAAAGGVPAA
jgi:diguanylate cyclase (GGDEF)-like protein